MLQVQGDVGHSGILGIGVLHNLGCCRSWGIWGSMGSWNGSAGPVGRFGVLWILRDLGSVGCWGIWLQREYGNRGAGFRVPWDLSCFGVLGSCGARGDEIGVLQMLGVLWKMQDLGCSRIMRSGLLWDLKCWN